MPKIKEVPNSEVHWQMAGLNVKDAANARIKMIMGADAGYFAPVYVNPSSYYWSDPNPEGWMPLTIVSPEVRAEAESLIEEIRTRAVKRAPSKAETVDRIMSYPNDDFVFVRNAGDHLDLRITGWGFGNFRRAQAVRISETLNDAKPNEITVSFSIDGASVPHRQFQYAAGVDWLEATTDDQGLYNFGAHNPGRQITVRDKKTGIEKITTVEADTTNIDVDVTEFLNVRVIARHDHAPITGEVATGIYGRREMQFDIVDGTSTIRLPWYEGEECAITFRGQTQKRELRKDVLNEFVFDSETPRMPHTVVKVTVTDHGQPVLGEVVNLNTPAGFFSLVTNPDGVAYNEFDLHTEGDIRAEVRGKNCTKPAIDGTVEFNFELDTPLPVEFDCYLRVVNSNQEPMGFYPVDIRLGNDDLVSCMTNEQGLVGPIHVLSGNTMTAFDGNDHSNWGEYELDANQQEYILQLPYENTPNKGDVSLRVVLRNGAPAAGVTCILTQDNLRITALLDNDGRMTFGSDDYDMRRPLKVDLYSTMRTFPSLQLPLDPQEFEYELVEVDGPQPWWKIAGEIALAGAALLSFVGLYFGLEAIYSRIPYLFG